MNSGLFITFEGTEGSGKTTHIHRLTEDLTKAGHRVKKTREPGGTDIGDQIRTILLDVNNSQLSSTAELMLYAASRAQHVGQKIIPALKTGAIVVSDRFADASVAYQGYGQGVELDELSRMGNLAAGAAMPDLTLILDLPVDDGFARTERRSDDVSRYEQMDRAMHERMRQGFLSIAEAKSARCRLIDATLDSDSVHQAVWHSVQERFKIEAKQND